MLGTWGWEPRRYLKEECLRQGEWEMQTLRGECDWLAHRRARGRPVRTK